MNQQINNIKLDKIIRKVDKLYLIDKDKDKLIAILKALYKKNISNKDVDISNYLNFSLNSNSTFKAKEFVLLIKNYINLLNLKDKYKLLNIEQLDNHQERKKVDKDFDNKIIYITQESYNSILIIDRALDRYLGHNNIYIIYDNNKSHDSFDKIKNKINKPITNMEINANKAEYYIDKLREEAKNTCRISINKNYLIKYFNIYIKTKENKENDLSFSFFTRHKSNSSSLEIEPIINEIIINGINNNMVIDNSCLPILEIDNIEFNNNDNIKEIPLEEMIGLNNVKEQLEKIYSLIEFNKKLNRSNDKSFNIAFLGNPGTGKTTVARLYKNKLFDLGVIKEDKIIEITPNDLVARFVGHTKDTARRKFNEARGGILFIDEAYLFKNTNYSGGNSPFMEEALVELLKYMEDSNNVIIFAGYTDNMKTFINSNPGIKSRMNNYIVFDDYNSDELLAIFNLYLRKEDLILDNNIVLDNVLTFFKNVNSIDNFGNGRFVKDFVNKIINYHALECNKTNKYTNIIKSNTLNKTIEEYNQQFIYGDKYSTKEFGL